MPGRTTEAQTETIALSTIANRRRRWVGSTLTIRAVLITCLVALISVIITAAVALPLTIKSANQEAWTVLASQARIAANAIEGRAVVGEQREDLRARRVAQTLRDDGVSTVLILNGQPDQSGLAPWIVKQIADGKAVSQIVVYKGRTMIAVGRPAGNGNGIVLMRPASGTIRNVLGRLGWALLAGLAAGLLAGVLLARRLGRPLRDVATAARRLSGGDRTARASTEAPSEVADVSVALNELAAALAISENRQRAFLMSVSHELRTPLTTIKGYAEALADGVIGPEGAQRVGQTMLDESAHLDRLVGDLLVLARLEADDFPLEVASVELVALMAKAAQTWSRRYADVGIELRTELPAHAVVVRTDAGRVRQVVDGLLENALRVVAPGAPVVLAVRAPTLVAYVAIEVRDGGPGLTDEDLAVAFDRGVLHKRYQAVRKVGSGIGLALAARLVSRLGGLIEAGHAAEGGARMTVLLPGHDER